MTTPLRVLFALAALFSIRAMAADEVRLDLVGDVTDAGKRFVHPAPDKPVYYLPNTVGYKEMGGYLAWQKPPPLTPKVEHMIAKALYEQGYRLMTKQNPPSILLVFWWGYIAPEMIDASAGMPGIPMGGSSSTDTGTSAPAGAGGNTLAKASQEAGNGLQGGSGQVSRGLNGILVNENQMLTLLAGEKYDLLPQSSMSFKSSPLRDEINHAELEAHYYVMITAFDFQAALKRKMVKLWTARMSTGSWGTSLDNVLPALIAAGAPIFGLDTMPTFIQRPVDPTGRVIVGTPEVKDFPTVQAAGKK